MKGISELPKLMITVLDGSTRNEDTKKFTFTSEAKCAMRKIAEYARTLKWVRKFEAQDMPEKLKSASADHLYFHMLVKTATAPDSLLRDYSILFLMPTIVEKYQDEWEREENEKSEMA